MDERQTAESIQKFTRIVSICMSALLILFEVIICTIYFNDNPSPVVWRIASLITCAVILDILYFVELYCVKTLKARIVIYCFDFVTLLSICAITADAYIAVMYCVILTQLYLNVVDIKPKLSVCIVSCVLFLATCILGWWINNMRAITTNEMLKVISGGLVGVLAIIAHFIVANFLIGFYRTNRKLTAALKQADESKAQLEDAYKQLSETAVFEERNRIARDIHDNAGHSMTSVIMQTEAAKLLIDSNPEEAKAKIISANIQAKNALEQMRESVHLLAGRSAARTLKEDVEEIIAQTMDGTDIIIRYDVGEVELAYPRHRFIANSLKECLSNGMRHGGATAFYVELAREGDSVSLIVSDNGTGLPEDFKEGFGLKGIRENAASFGGNIVLESEPGDGCEITVTIKAEEEEEK